MPYEDNDSMTVDDIKKEIVKSSISAKILIDLLINHAIESGASDIHIDPKETCLRIRLRIDGLLEDKFVFPKEIHHEIIGRLKIMSRLRTDEHHCPQDGRLRFIACSETLIDIRISIIPTHYGENAVLRLLIDTTSNLKLADLGLPQNDLSKIMRELDRTNGMILVTGPTGSGKTTTLYTLLKHVNIPSKSIITLEDPIEYAIDGVRQIQVNTHKGLGFSNGLRSIVRQDPDIIMVGEIRDTETAKIATNIALTGHMILTTLHTTNAASALTRLLDMGIDAYLVASTVKIVIAQRLVRKLFISSDGASYKGRACIFEVMIVSAKIQDAIMKRFPSYMIDDIAKTEGMQTLYEDGMRKANSGITTAAEVMRTVYD